MNNIKCECGHVNPEGTVLCEACGKPIERNQHIDGNDKKKLLNMRYDGTARRSQTYNRSIVDKVWSFFSSVKVGIWLIVIALIASAIGTIYPQAMYIPSDAPDRDPAVFYEDAYGLPGKIYYQLGFDHLYSSWWYLLIISLIGVSLVICSLDRFIPLHRALKIQKPRRHETFLSRQRYYSKTDDVSDDDLKKVKETLKKNRYRITEQDGHVLAEKGRFSRWGPYVNHIGLIIILLAALLRTLPWFYLDEYVWVREGEQKVVPGTNGEYYIKNNKFIMEVYDKKDKRFQSALQKKGEDVPSNFQTNATIYKKKGDTVAGAEPELQKVMDAKIRLNHPAKFGGYTVYQSGYQQNEFKDMTFNLHETDDPKKIMGTFTVDFSDVKGSYDLGNGYKVNVQNYYPEYYLDEEDKTPRSKSKYARFPAFVFSVVAPGKKEPELSFVGIGKNIDATGKNEYKLGIEGYETLYTSGLPVKRDYTLPLFGIGALIFMLGVVQGMYWQHRRIWLHPTKDGSLLLAGHTNKNWHGLKKDIEKAIAGTSVKMVDDQQELDE